MNRAMIRFYGIPQVHEVEVNVEETAINFNNDYYFVRNILLDAPVSGNVYRVIHEGIENNKSGNLFTSKYYHIPNCSVLGYDMPIPLPTGVRELEVGASLGVVIGRTAKNVTEDEAFSYIAGYTVVNDVQVHSNDSSQNGDHCSIGPWVIKCDAVVDFNTLSASVFINNKLHQETNLFNLNTLIARLIAYITKDRTLQEGDTLLIRLSESNTSAKEGDLIRIEINGIGALENLVLPEHLLLWMN